MSYVYEGLSLFGPTRLKEQSDAVKASTPINIAPRHKRGYCESCKKEKPAPRRRYKGWRCADCAGK